MGSGRWRTRRRCTRSSLLYNPGTHQGGVSRPLTEPHSQTSPTHAHMHTCTHAHSERMHDVTE